MTHQSQVTQSAGLRSTELIAQWVRPAVRSEQGSTLQCGGWPHPDSVEKSPRGWYCAPQLELEAAEVAEWSPASPNASAATPRRHSARRREERLHKSPSASASGLALFDGLLGLLRLLPEEEVEEPAEHEDDHADREDREDRRQRPSEAEPALGDVPGVDEVGRGRGEDRPDEAPDPAEQVREDVQDHV